MPDAHGCSYDLDAPLSETWLNADADLDQTLDRIYGIVKACLFVLKQFDFHNALDTALSNDDGHADIHVVDTILTGQMRRTGEQPLFVFQVAFCHRNGAGGGRIIGRSGFQKRDNLGTAIGRAVNDCVDALLR